MTKVFLLVFFSLSLATASVIEMMDKDLETEDSLWNLYERWRSHNNVSRDVDEKQKHFKVFKDNARAIHQFNKRKDVPYTLGLKKFADMTNEEFSAAYTGFGIHRHRSLRDAPLGGFFSRFQIVNLSILPYSVDWRQKGRSQP